MPKFLSGYKTLIVGVAMIVYAVSGWALGYVEPQHAWEVILAALAVLGLRDAVRKASKPDADGSSRAVPGHLRGNP